MSNYAEAGSTWEELWEEKVDSAVKRIINLFPDDNSQKLVKILIGMQVDKLRDALGNCNYARTVFELESYHEAKRDIGSLTRNLYKGNQISKSQAEEISKSLGSLEHEISAGTAGALERVCACRSWKE